MSRAKTNTIIKRIVDAAMTVLLLCLMAYQVTGEMAHEWIGMGMTVLVIIHQILNRKWYSALFKGKYNPYRSITTVLNILLMASFVLTAFCGMSMSSYAVPFLYGITPVSFVRRMHLSMSHWAFVLMGLHLGMHIPAMTAGLKLNDRWEARSRKTGGSMTRRSMRFLWVLSTWIPMKPHKKNICGSWERIFPPLPEMICL